MLNGPNTSPCSPFVYIRVGDEKPGRRKRDQCFPGENFNGLKMGLERVSVCGALIPVCYRQHPAAKMTRGECKSETEGRGMLHTRFCRKTATDKGPILALKRSTTLEQTRAGVTQAEAVYAWNNIWLNACSIYRLRDSGKTHRKHAVSKVGMPFASIIHNSP